MQIQNLPFEQNISEIKPVILTPETARFDGSDYNASFDNIRLTGQLKRVFECMRDGVWRTYREINKATGDPEASISAQLRHLRKPRFGSHTVNKRHRGEKSNGLYEYQLIVNA